MKKKEIKEAYDRIPFSEDIEEKLYRDIMKQNTAAAPLWKKRWVPVLIGIALFGTTVYGAEKLDWFTWLYGKDAGIIETGIERQDFASANGHLQMSIESSVFTDEVGVVFVHLQALDQKGKEFMERHLQTVYPALIRSTSEENGYKSGSGSGSVLLENMTDEENWYYRVTIAESNISAAKENDNAMVVLHTIEQVSERTSEEKMLDLSVTFPIRRSIGKKVTYDQCPEIRDITVTPLSVTLTWDQEKFAEQKIDMEIVFQNGNVFRYSRGSDDHPDIDSALITSDEKNHLSKVVLIPAQILDVDQIEKITLNGLECAK